MGDFVEELRRRLSRHQAAEETHRLVTPRDVQDRERERAASEAPRFLNFRDNEELRNLRAANFARTPFNHSSRNFVAANHAPNSSRRTSDFSNYQSGLDTPPTKPHRPKNVGRIFSHCFGD